MMAPNQRSRGGPVAGPHSHPHPDPTSGQLEAGRREPALGVTVGRAGDRSGVGLCLSGGGYRAALFHLGALRRLNELGVLGRVRTFSSVSGGAIAANLLADPRLVWPAEVASSDLRPVSAAAASDLHGVSADSASDRRRPNTAAPGQPRLTVEGFEEHVATPLAHLTGRNVRTPALLSMLKPWRWAMPDSAVRALADQFADAVPWWSRDLRDNETGGPAIVVGATEVGYGVNWVFADPTAVRPHGRIGDYWLGYAEPPPGLRLADAVAASCAFPPFFAPMVLDGNALHLRGGHPEGESPADRAQILAQIGLTDGGVYDNLALEPVWKDHATVLVSDGGGVFRASTEHTWWGRLLRILAIATGGGSSVRLRWLHACIARDVVSGATWSADTVVPHGYPADVVDMVNAVRTDLDAFSVPLQRVLERHGYQVADQVVREHVPDLVGINAPLVPPHPDVADAAVARAALRGSAQRTLFGHW